MNAQIPPPPAENSGTATLVTDEERAPLVLKKVTAACAQEIAQRFDLMSESQPLLTDTHTPGEFLRILIDHGHNPDAVTFLAHAMPAREAVWWACLCTRYHLADSDAQYQQTHAAAEAWVRKPTEENRREAETCAETSHYSTPASWVAAAAFWSNGSIAPASEPVMEPPSYLYAHAVASAIIMSTGHGMPAEKEVEERYRNYLKHGIAIANGGNG